MTCDRVVGEAQLGLLVALDGWQMIDIVSPLKIKMEPPKMEVWKVMFFLFMGDLWVPTVNLPGCI